jgi:hypothetical protein
MCAAALIRRHGNAEVVDQVILAVNLAFMPLNICRDAFPGEVRVSQHFLANEAVAIHARFGAGIIVVSEEADVKSSSLISTACQGVAVENVDYAIAILVFGRIGDPILVEVPAVKAGDPVIAVSAHGTICTVCSVLAILAADYHEGREDKAQKGRKPEFSAP